jgi:microsomal dipeptidase-like Zn-dependent dipeptidase
MFSAPEDLKTAADFQRIPEEMQRRGYPETLIEKICYGNFARYILQFLKHDTDEDI